VLQCAAVCFSVLQSVVVCCSVVQCVAVPRESCRGDYGWEPVRHAEAAHSSSDF
jgi:hypothetical protein